MAWIIVASIGCSIIASVITTKILATRYFEIVDGYVGDMCDKTKDFVKNAKTKVDKL